MNIKCVVVDDEPLAISVLERYINQLPFLLLVEKFTNPVKAFEFINENEIDLLFVDIQMPDLTGIELVSNLKNKPLVIFTTAYSEFAIDGFKADAIDYLLKPIDLPDFLRATNKAKDWIELKKDKTSLLESNQDFLFIKSEFKLIRINFNEIKYIQGMSEYVKIHLTAGKPIMSILTFKSLEEKLPENNFMRVHKSYIVNLNKIKMIERGDIVYDDGTVIPVSNQYKDQFKLFLDKNFML